MRGKKRNGVKGCRTEADVRERKKEKDKKKKIVIKRISAMELRATITTVMICRVASRLAMVIGFILS